MGIQRGNNASSVKSSSVASAAGGANLDYTFSTSSQAVYLDNVDPKSVFLIVHKDSGATIYNPLVKGLGGTIISNRIELEKDVSSLTETELLVYYNSSDSVVLDQIKTSLETQTEILVQVLSILKGIAE